MCHLKAAMPYPWWAASAERIAVIMRDNLKYNTSVQRWPFVWWRPPGSITAIWLGCSLEASAGADCTDIEQHRPGAFLCGVCMVLSPASFRALGYFEQLSIACSCVCDCGWLSVSPHGPVINWWPVQDVTLGAFPPRDSRDRLQQPCNFDCSRGCDGWMKGSEK